MTVSSRVSSARRPDATACAACLPAEPPRLGSGRSGSEWRSHPIEERAQATLGRAEGDVEIALQRRRPFQAADEYGVVAGVPDQLRRDVSGALVGGEEVARPHALGGDLVVERREIGVEALG